MLLVLNACSSLLSISAPAFSAGTSVQVFTVHMVAPQAEQGLPPQWWVTASLVSSQFILLSAALDIFSLDIFWQCQCNLTKRVIFLPEKLTVRLPSLTQQGQYTHTTKHPLPVFNTLILWWSVCPVSMSWQLLVVVWKGAYGQAVTLRERRSWNTVCGCCCQWSYVLAQTSGKTYRCSDSGKIKHFARTGGHNVM